MTTKTFRVRFLCPNTKNLVQSITVQRDNSEAAMREAISIFQMYRRSARDYAATIEQVEE